MSRQIIYEINSDNKIFNHDESPSLSKNIDFPSMELSFQHFYHQSRLKLDIIKQFDNKKKIYLVMSEYETEIDEYDETIKNISNEYFSPKYPILGRTFYKLWEMFFLFDIIDLEDNNYTTVLLDEPNTNLLRSVMLFKDKFGSKSKNSKNNKYISIIINNEYVEKNKKNKKSTTEYPVETSIGKTKANLIITNAFKTELTSVMQEQDSYKLILNQIIFALKHQTPNGTFICKIYETYTNVTAKIIACLTCFYDKVYIVKPLMSRDINSEKYIICQNLKKGSSQKNIDKLEDIVKNLDKHKNKNLTDIFPDYVLNANFKNTLISMNGKFGNQQFININEIVTFINKQNYRGYEYSQKREQQIEATKQWIENYFPSDKEYANKKKHSVELRNTIIKNSSLNVEEITSKLSK